MKLISPIINIARTGTEVKPNCWPKKTPPNKVIIPNAKPNEPFLSNAALVKVISFGRKIAPIIAAIMPTGTFNQKMYDHDR